MNYIKNCKEVILRPSDFYRRMPTIGGYSEPVIFAAISMIISLLLKTIVSYSMFIFGIHSSILTFGSMTVSKFDFSIFSNVIEMFFLGVAVIFIEALIVNLLYKKLGGTGSYEGTVRFISYGYAINVLSWIPLLNLIAVIYGLYIFIVGGSFVYNVSMGRSAVVALLYPVITVILIIFIAVLAGLSSFD